MEQISKKLKRKSTLKDNNFDYTIKNSSDRLSPKILEDTFSRGSSPKLPEKPLPSRKVIRHRTADIIKPVDQVLKLSNSPTIKKICEIPIDFTSSLLGSPKSVISPKEEFSGSFSSKVEKITTPKFDPHANQEENKILELNSSQEMSYEDLKLKNRKIIKSISYDIEKNIDPLIKKNNQLTYEILLKELTNLNVKPGQTLETDKNNEIKDCVRPLNIKLIPCEANRSCLTFEEALRSFYSLVEVYTEANLWITSLSDCLCSCFIKKQELSSEFTELCEKAIFFAYSGFDSKNQFHTNLLESVFASLQHLTGGLNWVDCGFSSNNPIDKDLSHNIAPFGLLFMLFMNDYFNDVLKRMIDFCIDIQIAFISLAFDVAEIALLTLRKKKLNFLMNNSQKCLEILFFFFAGLLTQWFSLYKELGSIRSANKKLENLAFKEQSQFINLAKNLLVFQI